MHHAAPGACPLLVTLPIRVQTYDIDFAGHVNNGVYIRWLEDLRTEMLYRHGGMEALLADGLFPVLASTHIHYKRPILLHDAPEAVMWCTQLGYATITLHAEIRVAGAVHAHAVQRGMLVKHGTMRAARFPADFVARFHASNTAPG